MSEQTSSNRNDISNGVKVSVIDTLKTANCTSDKKQETTETKKEDGDGRQAYLTMFIAEVIGTAMLMFLGCMGGINTFDSEPTPTHHYGGITFGLTVMLVIQTFGHISGAHLNPAVTIATVLLRILKPLMAVVYIIGQFVGATIGYGLLTVLVPDYYAPSGFCATTVDHRVSVVQALCIEIVITTMLILICCAVWDKRNESKPDSVPLRFGFAVAAISMAAGPLTGASMNTARSFAPLVYGGSWANHWIYWVGPNLAAPIGCVIYRVIFKDPAEDKSKRDSIYLNDVSHQSGDKV